MGEALVVNSGSFSIIYSMQLAYPVDYYAETEADSIEEYLTTVFAASNDTPYNIEIPEKQGTAVPTQSKHNNMLAMFDYAHMPRNYLMDYLFRLGKRKFALCGMSRHSGLVKTANAIRQYAQYYEIEKEVSVGIVEDASMSLNKTDATLPYSSSFSVTSLFSHAADEDSEQQLVDLLQG